MSIKTLWQRRKRQIIIGGSVILLILVVWTDIVSNRPTTITLIQPQDGASIQASSTIIEGIVTPKNAMVSVNGIPVILDSNGQFSSEVALPDATNTITVTAFGNTPTTSTLTINRIFAPGEQAEIAKEAADAKAQADADEKAAEAQAKAAQEAYDSTPAGKACKGHPDWSADICEVLGKGHVSIGMDEEQALVGWGQPDHVNTTTTVLGTHEQWVYDYSSYLYFDNGILTSIQN